MGKKTSRAQHPVRAYYGTLAVVLGVYIVLVFLSPQKSSVSQLGVHPLVADLLRLLTILPYVITWSLAIHGLAVLKRYVLSATKDNELAPILEALRKGLGWIIFCSIAAAFVSVLRPYLAGTGSAIILINNYLYIIPPLIGFGIMYRNIKRLQTAKKIAATSISDHVIRTALVSVLIGFYVFLIFTDPGRHTLSGASATYYLPDILIILTMVVPIFITWWLSFSVAFTLGDIIPRITQHKLFKGMTKILYGIWSIIFTFILLQAVLSLGASRLQAMGIGVILLLISALLLSHSIGYLLVVLGVRTLRKPQ